MYLICIGKLLGNKQKFKLLMDYHCTWVKTMLSPCLCIAGKARKRDDKEIEVKRNCAKDLSENVHAYKLFILETSRIFSQQSIELWGRRSVALPVT